MKKGSRLHAAQVAANAKKKSKVNAPFDGDDHRSKQDRAIAALETIARCQSQSMAILQAYLNSPLAGIALNQLPGELGEHALKLRKEVLAILNTK